MPESSGEEHVLDSVKVDADYRPFPTFEAWSTAAIDVGLWNSFVAAFKDERSQANEEIRKVVLRFALREAAVDTGAIEGLYSADRGFTITVAAQAAAWESLMREKGPEVLGLFEAQLKALDLVLDVVASRDPEGGGVRLSEAWIRRLHEVLLESVDVYRVRTPQGVQDQPLPKGEYKRHPNHVRQNDGSVHAYCPVDRTASEMHRLIEELGRESFARAHPVLQASYAHYALVAIHPFADGNGRVARAFASVFLYRAVSIPLVIFADQKVRYWAALSLADRGEPQAFVAFIHECAIDTVRELTLRFEKARSVPAEQSLSALESLYVGHGNLSHQEFDAVGARVCDWVREEFENRLMTLKIPRHVVATVDLKRHPISPGTPGYRRLVAPETSVVDVRLRSAPPASAEVRASYHIVAAGSRELPFAFVIEKLDSEDSFEVRLTEVDPAGTPTFRDRLSTWVDLEVGRLLERLSQDAEKALRGAGF